MQDLTFAPKAEFDRVLALNAPAAERTALFATLARLNALSMIMAAGSGHIGSSFSSLDIVSWLYLNEMRLPKRVGRDVERDIFFSSKGHDAPGLYAVMIALGQLPEEMRLRLRRHGGLPGHPDVLLTPYIEANTGSLGMGISKAKGMAIANRLNGRQTRLFVMIGDGELQEGQNWESLSSAVCRGLSEITVIVDHNKVQSDRLVKDTADLGDLAAKFAAFGWNVLRGDGHDMTVLERLIAAAKAETARPTVIIADTIKGRGVSFMEHTAMKDRWYRFHSGAPNAEDYARGVAELMALAKAQSDAMQVAAPSFETTVSPPSVPAPRNPQRLPAAYGRALVAEAEHATNLVALDADLVLDTGLIPFSEKFPERFIECGIAEQDMVSQASGLALAGMLPVVHSFACFLTPRANEQMYNADSENNKIIYVGSLAGVVPSGPGHSHQSVRDIALMGSLPNTVAIEPSCEAEVAQALRWAVRDNRQSTYLRLTSVGVDIPFALPADYELQPGRGVALTEGNDIVVFAYGPIPLKESWIASQEGRKQGFGLKVVNLPWLTSFDDAWLRQTIAGAKAVLCVDNHLVSGGQGERIAARLAEMGIQMAVKVLGLREVPACGRNDEVLRHHGLDAAGILQTAQALVRRAS